MVNGEPQIDPHSETWHAVKAKVNEAIGAHQRICETPSTPQDQTENARGALLALRGILLLVPEGTSQKM